MLNIENLKIEANEWNSQDPNSLKRACIKKIIEKIKVNYTDGLTGEHYLGGGTFAEVYEATRRKRKDPESTKNVAVRIVVTNNTIVYKREKKPATIFSNIKTDNKSAYNEIKEYISIPKLKYDFTIHLPNESTMHGLVFESELADNDANPSSIDDETPDDTPDYIQHVYIRNLVVDGAEAIKKLSSTNHIHNDIKPNNFLMTFDDSRIFSFKLTDLGAWCSKKEFKKIDDKDKKEFLKKLNAISDDKEKQKFLNDYIDEKTKRSRKQFLKRFIQNSFFSSPEKLTAQSAVDKMRETSYTTAEAEKFIDDYNHVVNLINAIDTASDVYSFGKSLEIIAVETLNAPKATGSKSQDIVRAFNNTLSTCSNTKPPATLHFKPRTGNKEDKALGDLIDKLTKENKEERLTLDNIKNQPYVKNPLPEVEAKK